MKFKFVFISLLFCCFITNVEAQEDRSQKNQIGLVSSFLFYDGPDSDYPKRTECPLSFYYQRTLSPRISVGFRLAYFRKSTLDMSVFDTWSIADNRNVYHLFSRVSMYSSAKFNAYIKPEVSYGQYKNITSYYSPIKAEAYYRSALDIGCRFTLKGRFSILFEKECMNYTIFQLTDDYDSLNYFNANSFLLEGIRLGVEMGF